MEWLTNEISPRDEALHLFAGNRTPSASSYSFGVLKEQIVHLGVNYTMDKRILLVFLVSLSARLVPAAEDDKPDVGTVIGIDLGTTYSW